MTQHFLNPALQIIAANYALLQFCVDDTMDADADQIWTNMKASTVKALKALHPYKISPHKQGFYTRVIDPTILDAKHRKTIIGKTEDEVLQKLLKWYAEDINKLASKDLPLIELFEEWMLYREQEGTSPNTLARDRNRVDKYFRNTAFFSKRLKDISRLELKLFCSKVISGGTTTDTENTNKLTRKEWNSTRCILNGMMSYAVEKGYISTNPLPTISFPERLFKKQPRRTSDREIWNSTEEAHLVSWCEVQFKETSDLAYLVPILILETGLRIGECVALKWSDLITPHHLLIERSEKSNKLTKEVYVDGNTKTYNDRIILLSNKALTLWAKIKDFRQDEEWVFARNCQRITARQASYILDKYALRHGLKRKGMHSLRKTFGSNLRRKGAIPRQCSDYLGNSEQVYLQHYSYDTATDSEFLQILNKEVM